MDLGILLIALIFYNETGGRPRAQVDHLSL